VKLYIIQRIARIFFTFLIFETLIFFLIKAIPGEKFTVRPPQPKPVTSQTEPGESDKAIKPTACPAPPQLPRGLPEDDAKKYCDEINQERILKGCPPMSCNSKGTAPIEPQVSEEQTPTPKDVQINPTAFQQYLYWLQGLLRRDLGISTTRRAPVVDVLSELAPRTLLLILPGALIGFFLGLRLGSISSWKRSGAGEFASTLAGVAFFTAFPPFLSFLLAAIFAHALQWLPRENITSVDVWIFATVTPNRIINWLNATLLIDTLLIFAVWFASRRMIKHRKLLSITGVIIILALTGGLWIGKGYGPYAWDIIKHLVLPLSALILLTFGGTMLLMRASMMEVLKETHIISAKAKGLPDAQVRDRHVARLALIPVVSRFVCELPLVIISCFAIERVFYWIGLGQFLFEAANKDDYHLVLGILTIVGIVILAAHLFVDVLNLVLDPRMRKTLKTAEGG
jgi:peptide/nickel transport system permease protein